jgi:hypothetical protein
MEQEEGKYDPELIKRAVAFLGQKGPEQPAMCGHYLPIEQANQRPSN